jgi:WD40 repeat protein
MELWDVKKKTLIRTYESKPRFGPSLGYQQPVAFCPKKNQAVIGKGTEKEFSLILIDLSNNEEIRSYRNPDISWQQKAAISGDGNRLVCQTYEGDLASWDLNDGKQVWHLRDPNAKGQIFAFSPEARYGICATGVRSGSIGDMRIVLWDTLEGKLIGEFSVPDFPIP